MEATTKGREITAYREGFVPVKLQSYNEALRFAKELIDTGLLPNYIKRPSQAVAIILTGQEMGIPPMRALRTIYIVEGQPSMKAEQMLAHFKARGGKAREVKSTADECEWTFTHPNGDEHTERLTFADCKSFATTKSGGLKSNWKSNPGQRIMLRWRTIATGLRAAAPDLYGGAIYTPEEMEDVTGATEVATADNVDNLKERLMVATNDASVRYEILETTEPVSAEEQVKIEADQECRVCGDSLTLDNIADANLCLPCAERQAAET
jgi:hypothetical protein